MCPAPAVTVVPVAQIPRFQSSNQDVPHSNPFPTPLQVCEYDFSKPGFASATGHYTQMVWADTRTVGCGYTACPDGVMGLGAKTGVLVCQYW